MIVRAQNYARDQAQNSIRELNTVNECIRHEITVFVSERI